MKKISQSQWVRYKKTDGKEVIELFEKVQKKQCSPEEFYDITSRFNPFYFSQLGESSKREIIGIFQYTDTTIKEILPSDDELKSFDDYADFYVFVLDYLAAVNTEAIETYKDIPQGQYKGMLANILFESFLLYEYLPDYFLPYFFTDQFIYLKKIAKTYEIDLPSMPKRSCYYDRCFYYMELCKVFHDFAETNNLSSAEMCAFLYDYAMTIVKEETEQEQRTTELPTPSQAWFLVGSYGDMERNMNYGFWQANAETRRGDILVFFEKNPVKSLNAIWRAQEDGIVDPFFYYYSNTYIGNKMDITPISLDELRADAYFKEHGLIRKNFQGGSGWPLTSEDYNQLKRMLAAKGFDITQLPKLKAHEAPANIDYSTKEAAVHEYQVLPLLADMGWTVENGEIMNQVTLHVGHGEAGKKGRTDISLHPQKEDSKKARVVIEEKYWMKNEAEIADTLAQGVSYADLQHANVLVLCDKAQIIVYQRDKNSDFKPNKKQVFYWDEMSNPDKFNELRKLIS